MPDGQPSYQALLGHINTPGDSMRGELAGQMIEALNILVKRAEQEGGECYLALYELNDPELLEMLKGNKKLHIILSNTGQDDATDVEARQSLHDSGVDIYDRMLTSGHIGHNKFTVYVDKNGNAQAVATGSTNWTSTALCAQSNNTLIIEDPNYASAFKDYWERLKADGAEQSAEFRSRNNEEIPPLMVDGSELSLYFSPNTQLKNKPQKDPEEPADMAAVADAIRSAKESVLFLAFQPGSPSFMDVIAEAQEKNPSLFVRGAVTDPKATAHYVSLFHGSMEQADSVVTASAVNAQDQFGYWQQELLKSSPGAHAIIHDKIIVIDPFTDNCKVITGSHNLGYRASYNNDENLTIIKNDRELAQMYAAHALDVYDHYRWRYQLQKINNPVRAYNGLDPIDVWQNKYYSQNTIANKSMAVWFDTIKAKENGALTTDWSYKHGRRLGWSARITELIMPLIPVWNIADITAHTASLVRGKAGLGKFRGWGAAGIWALTLLAGLGAYFGFEHSILAASVAAYIANSISHFIYNIFFPGNTLTVGELQIETPAEARKQTAANKTLGDNKTPVKIQPPFMLEIIEALNNPEISSRLLRLAKSDVNNFHNNVEDLLVKMSKAGKTGAAKALETFIGRLRPQKSKNITALEPEGIEGEYTQQVKTGDKTLSLTLAAKKFDYHSRLGRTWQDKAENNYIYTQQINPNEPTYIGVSGQDRSFVSEYVRVLVSAGFFWNEMMEKDLLFVINGGSVEVFEGDKAKPRPDLSAEANIVLKKTRISMSRLEKEDSEKKEYLKRLEGIEFFNGKLPQETGTAGFASGLAESGKYLAVCGRIDQRESQYLVEELNARCAQTIGRLGHVLVKFEGEGFSVESENADASAVKDVERFVRGFYTILNFSDVHAGSPYKFGLQKETELIQLLDKAVANRSLVIINGDFIDFWQEKYGKTKKAHQALFDKLKQARRVIYIAGNHDRVIHPDFLEGAKKELLETAKKHVIVLGPKAEALERLAALPSVKDFIRG